MDKLLLKSNKIGEYMHTRYKKSKIPSFTSMSALCATVMPLLAFADVAPVDGFYGSVDGGVTFLQKFNDIDKQAIKHKTGFNAGGAFGYKLDDFRLEAEFRYLRNKVKGDIKDANTREELKVHFNNYAYMANGYYDFNEFTFQNFHPVIGAGVGYSRVTLSVADDDGTISEGFNALAYQVMPGIAYDVNDQISANLSYRYLGTTKLKDIDTSYQSHSINLGLTYRLGVGI